MSEVAPVRRLVAEKCFGFGRGEVGPIELLEQCLDRVVRLGPGLGAFDAHVVTALRDAGTISLGKTNTPEFGMSPYMDNHLAGPARIPLDCSWNASGSSGGAVASVAAGLVSIAYGGGSVRIPSSACGLVGIKPSRNRISIGPIGDIDGFSVSPRKRRPPPNAQPPRPRAARRRKPDARPKPRPGSPPNAPEQRRPPANGASRRSPSA